MNNLEFRSCASLSYFIHPAPCPGTHRGLECHCASGIQSCLWGSSAALGAMLLCCMLPESSLLLLPHISSRTLTSISSVIIPKTTNLPPAKASRKISNEVYHLKPLNKSESLRKYLIIHYCISTLDIYTEFFLILKGVLPIRVTLIDTETWVWEIAVCGSIVKGDVKWLECSLGFRDLPKGPYSGGPACSRRPSHCHMHNMLYSECI